ncbi:NAD-dependent DNA ligase LigA [Patescibacteria group bacterium]|nr:NAD-dependent DNA ligase LigA [Patescibacteria group bacterium]
MTKEEAKKRIEKLKAEVEHHRYLYHVLDRSEISDAALDSLKHELYKLEQEYPEFITSDSPTQRVGGEALKEFRKVFHEKPMLSIEDVFEPKELEAWEERIKKLLPHEKFDYYAEVKMDGLAVALVYENGIFNVGSTRGDGKIGEDVTQNLKTIEAIPLRLNKPPEKEIENFLKKYGEAVDRKIFLSKIKNLFEKIEIRGECFMDKNVFEKLNREQKKKGEPPFANPRNAAAGSIRQLNSKITASRKLDFFGYALITDLGQKTHEAAHEILKLLGVKVNPENRYAKNLAEVEEFHKYLEKIRGKLNYWMDGEIVVVNRNDIFDKLGVVGKTPRGMIAYKFPPEQATTKVLEVVWQVGRTGAITPVAVMDPVFVAGTTVTHSTLHNLDEIERLGVKIGDTVIIEKAGDVIPKVVQVLPNLRTGKEKKITPPEFCPMCETKLVRRPGEVAIYCPNQKCFAQTLRQTSHFVSKRAFNIDGLGHKILERFLEEGLIRDAADLYELEAGDVLPLERFAEKSAANLIEAIIKSKKISLGRLIYALGIRHVGEETAVDLANYFGSLEKLQNATLPDLEKVPNVGGVMAKSIIEWFHDKSNKNFLERLLKNVLVTKPVATKKIWQGLKFVLTGTLENLTRDAAKEKIQMLGGDVTSSVSKETNFVVTGSDPGSKYDKAKRLGVKTLDEKEFLEMLKKAE